MRGGPRRAQPRSARDLLELGPGLARPGGLRHPVARGLRGVELRVEVLERRLERSLGVFVLTVALPMRSVKFVEVQEAAKAQAAQAMEKTKIPRKMSEYVQDYIDSLNPERQ